jgi:hypothetical protein
MEEIAGVTDSLDTELVELTRMSPAYWRVTFDMPMLNIFGPPALPQLDAFVLATRSRRRRSRSGSPD